MKLFVFLSATTAASATVRLELFDKGNSGISSWDQTKQFCEDLGGTLATEAQWCTPNVFDGIKGDTQWAPIINGPNQWIQIGTFMGSTAFACNGYEDLCINTPPPTPSPSPGPTKSPTPGPSSSPTEKPTPGPTKSPTPGPSPSPTEKPTPGPTKSPTPAPSPSPTEKPTPGPTKSPTPGPSPSPTEKPTPGPTKQPTPQPTPSPTKGPGGLCQKPPNCVITAGQPSCAYQCDLAAGYYPDPSDCRSYCKSTGPGHNGQNAPCRYETIVTAGMTWDPFGTSYAGGPTSYKPLDPNNIPLGGMNGGLANWAYNVKDKSYCGNNYQNTWQGRRALRQRALSPPPPDNNEKCDIEPRYILCAFDPTPGPTEKPTEKPHPQPTPVPTEKPTSGPTKAPSMVTGDPHFTMFNSQKFDYHGECDLVFLKNPDFDQGKGLKIHIRTKIVTWWSYVQSAVVQIGGDSLEVVGVDHQAEDVKYWVNGELGPKVKDSGVMPFTIGGYTVRFRVLSDKKYQFKILLESGQNIVLRSINKIMRVDLQHPTEGTFGSSRGILGDYRTGKMLSRNGTMVFNHNNEVGVNAFGQEWQVNSEEPMLFHEVQEPQHPQPCVLPDLAAIERRRLVHSSITRDLAEAACRNAPSADKEDCISDVLTTGDIDMAGSY